MGQREDKDFGRKLEDVGLDPSEEAADKSANERSVGVWKRRRGGRGDLLGLELLVKLLDLLGVKVLKLPLESLEVRPTQGKLDQDQPSRLKIVGGARLTKRPDRGN